MRILLVITGLGVGGAERQVVDLADCYCRLGHEVKIAYLTGPVLLNPVEKGVELVGLGVGKSPAGLLRGIRALVGLCKRFRPDAVHSHMVHANLLARVSRVFVRMPRLISTAHSINEGGALRMLLYRITNGLADVTTNVSEEAVRAFEEKGAVPVGEMRAVPNGIDVDRCAPDFDLRERVRQERNAGELKILLAVGRLFGAKDYPNLLNAYAEVVKSRPDTKLWIAGGGPLQSELEALSRALGLQEHVVFLGVRNDVPALMNGADIFVLSSEWEGLPLVVGEAMASGKVVVATDVGGVREFVGDAGFLVPSRDSKALAAGIGNAIALCRDDSEDLARRARERIVQIFSLDKAVATWLDIYARVA